MQETVTPLAPFVQRAVHVWHAEEGYRGWW